MDTSLDINIFKVIDAGHFWANPVAQPDFMGKLNDHFRNSTTPEVINLLAKGQMCVVRRTSDKCWYRARVQNVLQTLSGPQASVFLVDLAESTLIPCCWIREVPAEFKNIPFQAMECFLTGLKPLGLVTAYFDLTTSKQETDHWDEAATGLFRNVTHGCQLQVSIQNQDEKGRYHVLLFADSGHTRVCVNDELVINGFATNYSDTVENSGISPGKAAKLQAINDKFQKQGSEVIKNLKEYISLGKFTSSEQSNSTDEESMDYSRSNHRFLSSGESPLNVLKSHVSGSYSVENGNLGKPSARIPGGASQDLLQRNSPENSNRENASRRILGNESHSIYRRADTFSSDENFGHVRFVSSRLPATGSGYSSVPSKSPDSANLKPILKKSSPHSMAHQYSGSSSEPEDSFQRKHKQLDKESSGYSCSEIPKLASHGSDISLIDKKKKELAMPSNAISVDELFDGCRETLQTALNNDNFCQGGKAAMPLTQCKTKSLKVERSSQQVLSLMETLRNNSGMRLRQMQGTSAGGASSCEPSSHTTVECLTHESVPHHYECSPIQPTLNKEKETFANKNSQLNTHLSPSSTSSSSKSPLPSQMLFSTHSPNSPVRPTSGRKVIFSDGAVIQTEGAAAPRPIFSLEQSPYAYVAHLLGITSPSLIQAHAWPALRRGRDVVGICAGNAGQIFAYLVPIIYQLVEEREMYADLSPGSGPKLLILVPTWQRGDQIYYHCTEVLARNRNIRVQLVYAGGAEDAKIIQLVNGCEILIATPPCFLRMLRKGYVNLNKLCHTVFQDADLMVEDFTVEIKDIMRHYAKLLKSQPNRSAPRQAVVMATSWSVGVASLIKAYLGNPVLIIADMIEAAINRGVRQIATVCSASQRDVPLLGYIDSFNATKDICVFTSAASEADAIGEILKANCYYTLVAHEFLAPQELANVKRQWNTPHSTDAMPVLVMTDGVIDQMKVTNASCVIHYNYPGSKTKFCMRLTTLAETFASSEEHGCISVIIVTERCRPAYPANIAQLLKRSGEEVPSSLQEMLEVTTQETDRRKDLCYYLKALGTCRFQRENRHCRMRHTVLAEQDKPVEGLPTSGIVKVLILSVETTSCYWVRILEHRPGVEQQTASCSRTTHGTEFLELTMSVSGWYADPSNRVKHGLVSIGDLCAVMSGNSYQRVKVCCITGTDDHSNKPKYVKIQYVDRGAFEDDVLVDRLLQLPSQFHSCPFQAVEVFACRVQPLDKDLAWTIQGKHFVKHLIEGKEMEGRVVLSLGNTMWLDPLVQRTRLENINVTTNVVHVRMELLKEKLAAENKQHVRLLRSLCEGVIDLTPLEGGASGLVENSEESSRVLEAAVLPEEGFHSVYVSAVENPSLFFIQLQASEESLEELRQKINSGVNKVDVEDTEIAVGSFCVAKFSEDDQWYRARVMGSRPDDEYDVYYVDFGDREWVTGDRIVPAWNSILQLPLQAIECSLINVQPLGTDWSDKSSDAFWEMVNNQLLVAKVKSKSTSLVTGNYKFEIELYDTTTEHDVIISHEMVATAHAQTTPEATKLLFGHCTPDQVEYDVPYQRIPEMCRQAHQCRDLTRKIEIVKEVQSIVLNSEGYKDDIRDCGGVQALCRLLSLNRDPLVLQHILTSLASLAFENESNCDEVRKQGGLQTMCYLLGKTQDHAVEESLAWALKNLAAIEKNQNEARNRGGIKALCGLLKTASDEKVQERVAWALGSLVKDHASNCQAVQVCGGLKTLCELISGTSSENVLERAIWALGMLAIDVKNRNFIRQYGGIDNICKKLQESPSEQSTYQSALTLKTLVSNNQYNKEVMVELGLIGTLRSFMTDEPQRLGIISRRICWDLLQRLLGSAATALPTTSPPARAPATKTQGSSTLSGSVKKQEPDARLINGLADSDEDDDLPPLGEGGDSDKENEHSRDLPYTCAKSTPSETTSVQLAHRNQVISTRPEIQARPVIAEEENVVPFRVHPKTVWSQTRDLVRICVRLRGADERQVQTEITDQRLKFRTRMGRSLYELDLELFEDIDSEYFQRRADGVQVKGAEVQILLKKRNHAVWTRLLKSKERLPYVSIDFDRWEVWSSSDEDEEGEGAREAPANPINSRRQSEDTEEGKQVFVPEMLVSNSSDSDGEESVSSDVDCFNFN